MNYNLISSTGTTSESPSSEYACEFKAPQKPSSEQPSQSGPTRLSGTSNSHRKTRQSQRFKDDHDDTSLCTPKISAAVLPIPDFPLPSTLEASLPSKNSEAVLSSPESPLNSTLAAPLPSKTSAAVLPSPELTLQSTSAASLPSLEHNRLLYRRPPPTDLQRTPPKSRSKRPESHGKNKQTPGSEWTPDHQPKVRVARRARVFDSESDASNPANHDETAKDKNSTSDAPFFPQASIGSNEWLSDTLTKILQAQASTKLQLTESSDTLKNMNKLLRQSHIMIEALNSEVKTLSHVVQKFSGGSPQEDSVKKKGGRTSVGYFLPPVR